MNVEDKLISVIIPIFNTKQYMDRCIKSVLAQTYKSIEIILVDDGSTDGSSDICDKYASEYECIKAIHKKMVVQVQQEIEGLIWLPVNILHLLIVMTG